MNSNWHSETEVEDDVCSDQVSSTFHIRGRVFGCSENANGLNFVDRTLFIFNNFVRHIHTIHVHPQICRGVFVSRKQKMSSTIDVFVGLVRVSAMQHCRSFSHSEISASVD